LLRRRRRRRRHRQKPSLKDYKCLATRYAFSLPSSFRHRLVSTLSILSCKPCAYFVAFFFRRANRNWKTKKKKPMPSAEHVALLNRVGEIVAHREIEAEQNTKQKEKEEHLMKEQEKEGWEGEEEEEEEEEEEDELFGGKERGQQTNNPKTPGGEDERKTKKRKQKESAERKEGV